MVHDDDLMIYGDFLSDWQQIRSLNVNHHLHQHHHHHHKSLVLPQPPLEKLQIKENEWSLVVIRDSDSLLDNNNNNNNSNEDLSVFPPINHENLRLHEKPISNIHTNNQQQQQKEASYDHEELDPPVVASDPSSPFDSSSRWWWVRENFILWGVWFRILRAKILGIIVRSSLYGWWCNKREFFRGAFSSFYPHVASLAVAAVFWSLRRRVLRRRATSVDRVMMDIKERDEKIIQLLHQIVQMNEALLAYQKISASKLAN